MWDTVAKTSIIFNNSICIAELFMVNHFNNQYKVFETKKYCNLITILTKNKINDNMYHILYRKI